jgi:Ca2+-binding EF-hand superfamily protein
MARPNVALLAILVFAAPAAQSEMPSGLTAWDRVVLEAAFRRADANDDGSLTKNETTRLAAFSARFDELDSDHDGSLTLEEFAVGFAAPQ